MDYDLDVAEDTLAPRIKRKVRQLAIAQQGVHLRKKWGKQRCP